MSSSEFFTKREPSEIPETADQVATHTLYQHLPTSAPSQFFNDTVPCDGNRKPSPSADEGPVANSQRCTTQSRDDRSKELEQISQKDFISSCKAWEKWYNAKQRDDQSVLQFTEYFQKLVASLPRHESGEPSVVEQFHRLRSGLRDSLKTILNAQLIQPTTFDDLINVALRIEEKEMALLGHTTVSRRKPLVPLPPSKPSKQTPSSYRPKPGQNGYTSHQRAKKALDHKARAPGPMPSKVSKRSRQSKRDIGISRHDELPLDQISLRDKNDNQCYLCGKSNHKTGECQEEGSKVLGALTFPVRPKVPGNQSNAG